jgi:Cof subfamily protein (haloacid dehalogenase superfamily)
MQFKAICTDIDGTLLNADRVLSAKTIDVIRRLATDVPVILASSRMPKAMRHLQAELGILHCPLICYNGGYVIHFDEGREPSVLHSTEIAAADCQLVLDLARGTEVHVSLYRADEWYVPAQDYWADREQNNTRVAPEVADLDAIVAGWQAQGLGAHKVMCMGPAEGITAITAALGQQSSLNLYRSRDTYLEIAHGDINKATGLALLLRHKYDFGLSDVIAFGDNYNDIELLEAVGIGIAVGNAKPEVLAIARDIAAPGKEDGVALALEKWAK